jgi:hypothetical protein
VDRVVASCLPLQLLRLDGAQREHERLADQLQFALKQIQDRRDEIARGEQHRREATAERERLLARLDALKC